MAKGHKPSEQVGKVKFRIIEFEVEGSDESLQDSLKTMAAALMRGNGNAPKPVKYDTAPSLNSLPDEVDAAGDAVVAEEDISDVEVSRAPAKRLTQRAPKKITPGKIIDNVRFDDVEPGLEEFCASKKPASDLMRYLVIAYWYKHHKKISELSADHFFTAYRFMKWPVPKDISQPIRDLRNSRNGKFSGGTAPGLASINHLGENAVDKL